MAVEKAISYDQARKKINKAAPKGHQLAFITPAEAKMLKDKGGSGEMTEAGVKSYRGHHGGGGGGSSSGSGSGGGQGSGGGGGGDRNKDRGQKRGRKSAKGASLKSSKKTTTKTSKKSFSDKLKEARKKNEKALKDVARKQADFNKRTGFQTKGGFLRDSKGNIVRSKTQVDRFKDDKRRQDIARKLGIDTTLGAAAANPNLRSQEMTPGQFRLSGRLGDFKRSLGRGVQTPENLGRLVDINRQLGDFDYAGMGLGNQFRTQGADLVAGIPGLAKVASAVAGGPAGIAGLIASGGRGIGNLVLDALGRQQSERQPNLAESQDDAHGGLQSLFSGLRIGEGAPFVEDRGGGRTNDGAREAVADRFGMPPPATGGFAGKIPTGTPIKKAIPVTGQPVDDEMLNQYLALAGFSPQEIQGMPSAFRFLG